jgi:hypothetical protein
MTFIRRRRRRRNRRGEKEWDTENTEVRTEGTEGGADFVGLWFFSGISVTKRIELRAGLVAAAEKD